MSVSHPLPPILVAKCTLLRPFSEILVKREEDRRREAGKRREKNSITNCLCAALDVRSYEICTEDKVNLEGHDIYIKSSCELDSDCAIKQSTFPVFGKKAQ